LFEMFDTTDKIPGSGDAGPEMTMRGGTAGWVSGIHADVGDRGEPLDHPIEARKDAGPRIKSGATEWGHGTALNHLDGAEKRKACPGLDPEAQRLSRTGSRKPPEGCTIG
jgi:hypothetical protein